MVYEAYLEKKKKLVYEGQLFEALFRGPVAFKESELRVLPSLLYLVDSLLHG